MSATQKKRRSLPCSDQPMRAGSAPWGSETGCFVHPTATVVIAKTAPDAAWINSTTPRSLKRCSPIWINWTSRGILAMRQPECCVNLRFRDLGLRISFVLAVSVPMKFLFQLFLQNCFNTCPSISCLLNPFIKSSILFPANLFLTKISLIHSETFFCDQSPLSFRFAPCPWVI